MKNILRSIGVLTTATSFAIASAQGGASEVKTESHSTLIDHVSVISRDWWIATALGTVVLGLIVGYFVYLNKVSNSQSGKASGCGCFAAIVVFLCAQVLVIFVLLSTVFAARSNTHEEKSTKTETTSKTPEAVSPAKTESSTAKPQNGQNPKPTESTSSKPGPVPPTKPKSTGGDDF